MLNIELIHPDAKLPTKRIEDGGYDIYPAFDSESLFIQPGEIELIPTGIKSAFPKEFVGLIRERGSTGSKGWSARAGVIDSGYRGEWFIAINNTTNKPKVITKTPSKFDENEYTIRDYNKAIAQVLFPRVTHLETQQVDNIDTFDSERGENKLGSTD